MRQSPEEKKTKSLKICIFFHRFDDGGAEKMTVVLANELFRRGYDVTILIRYNTGPARALLDPAVKIIDMKLPERGKLKKNIRNAVWLRRALCPGSYDVLISVTAEMSQVAAFSTWFLRNRIPLVSVVHSTLSQEKHSFQKIRELLFPILNSRYDRVIAVSEAVRRDYMAVCKAGEDQVVTVYNPVVDDKFGKRSMEKAAHPWLEEGRGFITLVLAGRLCTAKNHKMMFQALRILNKNGDYRLILLGDGELYEELVKEAGRLGMTEKIDFAGRVANPVPYFVRADMVVLSSKYEGLPTVLIEALAAGAKIVSTDCPSGPREILKDESLGILVETENPEALAEGIIKAQSWNPDRERLRQRAGDFTVSKSIDGYLAVLNDVIEKRKISDAQKTGTYSG